MLLKDVRVFAVRHFRNHLKSIFKLPRCLQSNIHLNLCHCWPICTTCRYSSVTNVHVTPLFNICMWISTLWCFPCPRPFPGATNETTLMTQINTLAEMLDSPELYVTDSFIVAGYTNPAAAHRVNEIWFIRRQWTVWKPDENTWWKHLHLHQSTEHAHGPKWRRWASNNRPVHLTNQWDDNEMEIFSNLLDCTFFEWFLHQK